MSLIPTVYRSTDAGAPALTGQVGSLAALLDAVLVDGYGTGPSAKAGAGWTREFSDTNKRVYRNDTISGTGSYLRLDDTATVGNARHAFLRAYESMSDIDTGTGPAPTVAQSTNGSLWVKSTLLDSTSRAWTIVATELYFYMIVNVSGSGFGVFSPAVPYSPTFAGDIVSAKPGDTANFAVIGTGATTYTGGSINAAGAFYTSNAQFGGSPVSGGRGYLLRGHTLAAGAVECTPWIPGDLSFGIGCGSTRPLAPNIVTSGITLMRVLLAEGAPGQMRGFMPNIYATCEKYPFTHDEIQTSVAGLPAGTSILPHLHSFVVGTAPNTGNSEAGMVLFDLTNAWW